MVEILILVGIGMLLGAAFLEFAWYERRRRKYGLEEPPRATLPDRLPICPECGLPVIPGADCPTCSYGKDNRMSGEKMVKMLRSINSVSDDLLSIATDFRDRKEMKHCLDLENLVDQLEMPISILRDCLGMK